MQKKKWTDRRKFGDISLLASIFLILVALIATVGGAVMIGTVHAEQMSQSTAVLTASFSIPSATNSETTITIQSGSGANTTSVYYSPPKAVVVIGVNNTVKWVNNDAVPHTVTSDSGAFSSGNMNPGASWIFKFNAPGTYNYHCSYHFWMHGTVIVKQG